MQISEIFEALIVLVGSIVEELKDNIYEMQGQLYITFIPDSNFVWIQEKYGREPK